MSHRAWCLAWCASVAQSSKQPGPATSDSQFVFTFTAPSFLEYEHFNRRVRAVEQGKFADQLRYGVIHVDGPLGRLELFDLVDEYNRVVPEKLKLKDVKCFTMDEIDKTPLLTEIWNTRLHKPNAYRSMWLNPCK